MLHRGTRLGDAGQPKAQVDACEPEYDDVDNAQGMLQAAAKKHHHHL